MITFLDTSVLIHLLNPDAKMHSWSARQFESCKANGPVVVTDIVYCEFSVGMPSKEAVDAALSVLAVERHTTSDEVLFRAAAAFRQYKDQNKGPKLNVLPDFLIGASAEVVGVPILTTNPRDFLKYFPDVQTIAPDTDGC